MKKNILIGIIAGIFIIIGIIINAVNPKTPENIDLPEENTSQEIIYVHISGEVVKPGVYEMKADDRIQDLIILAGGFTSNADVDSINLVQKIVDGMKITVHPHVIMSSKISINRATITELKQLSGIGDVKAKAIIDYRNTIGLFTSIEDLVIYKLITEKDFDNIKDDITL